MFSEQQTGPEERSVSSIRDFLERDDREGRAARFIEAIINDSSFTVVVLDHEGRFVEGGPDHLQVVGQKPEDIGDRGQRLRYSDEHARELPFLKTPAAIARATGQPQRKRIFSVRYPNGRQVWLKGDQLPLEEGPRGWAVLGLSVDVTDLYIERGDA